MANELVLVSSRTEVRDSKDDNHDDLGIELEAMSTIGRALEAIEDPALRQRILNWAMQRWGVDRARNDGGASPSPGTATRPASDLDLSVDSLGELFEESPATANPGTAPAPHISPKPEGKAPVESMLQSLAADFQRLADEWNGDADAKT